MVRHIDVSRCRRRRGQALVEFAIVAFVLYFLFAGILTFGAFALLRSIASAGGRRGGQRIGPRSAAGHRVALRRALQHGPRVCPSPQPSVRSAVFACNLNSIPAGQTLADWVKTWPVVNQMLVPLMIVDIRRQRGNQPSCGIRGPCREPTATAGRSICIALVTGRQASGAENIEWVPVIEQAEHRTRRPGFDAFNVQSSYRGLGRLDKSITLINRPR